MRLRSKVIASVLMAGCVLLGLSALTGCQTQKRTEPGQTAQPTGERTSRADALAGSDAERAKADLDRQDQDARTGRPAEPPVRSGSRTVDQPRVSPRP